MDLPVGFAIQEIFGVKTLKSETPKVKNKK